MNVKEMRDKSENELQTRERELTEKLFKLRFQKTTGNLDKPSQIRDARREIARIKTLLGERSRA
jgi:large subunit ribosomal protein L29